MNFCNGYVMLWPFILGFSLSLQLCCALLQLCCNFRAYFRDTGQVLLLVKLFKSGWSCGPADVTFSKVEHTRFTQESVCQFSIQFSIWTIIRFGLQYKYGTHLVQFCQEVVHSKWTFVWTTLCSAQFHHKLTRNFFVWKLLENSVWQEQK